MASIFFSHSRNWNWESVPDPLFGDGCERVSESSNWLLRGANCWLVTAWFDLKKRKFGMTFFLHLSPPHFVVFVRGIKWIPEQKERQEWWARNENNAIKSFFFSSSHLESCLSLLLLPTFLLNHLLWMGFRERLADRGRDEKKTVLFHATIPGCLSFCEVSLVDSLTFLRVFRPLQFSLLQYGFANWKLQD